MELSGEMQLAPGPTPCPAVPTPPVCDPSRKLVGTGVVHGGRVVGHPLLQLNCRHSFWLNDSA